MFANTKRELFPSGRPAKRVKTNKHEIQKIKRTLAERKPEMKTTNGGVQGSLATGGITVIEVTDIAQGDTSFTRDGVLIKMHRIEYTAFAVIASTVNPAAGVDAYLVSSKGSDAPTYGDFVAFVGGTLNQNEFVTWRQHCVGDMENQGVIQHAYSFQFPMKVHYGGSTGTSGIRNRVWLVVKNNIASTVNVQLSYRGWYTDI